jgi:hypothetical protein
MGGIADFTDGELWIINSTLTERYGAPPDIELAESELRLDKGTTQLVPCPTVYWQADDCHFVVCKTGDRRYRCQFFYRLHQMYGTGIEEYDDLSECVVSLLQVQADHQAGERSEQDGV